MSSKVLAWSCTACDRIFLKEELANEHSLSCKGKEGERSAQVATITHDGPSDEPQPDDCPSNQPQCDVKKEEEPFEEVGSVPMEDTSIEKPVEPIGNDVINNTKGPRPIKRKVTRNTSVKGNVYKCVKCNRDFKTWLNYKKHSKSEYHKNINKQFPCPFCVNNVGFSSAKILRKHIGQHHTKTICIYCEKICKGERALHDHVKQNHVQNKDGGVVTKETNSVASFNVAKGCSVENVVEPQDSNLPSIQSNAGVNSVPMETDQNQVDMISAGAQNTPESLVLGVQAKSGKRFTKSPLSPGGATSSDNTDAAMNRAKSEIGDGENGIDRLAALGLTPVASKSVGASLKTAMASDTGKSLNTGTPSDTGSASNTSAVSSTGTASSTSMASNTGTASNTGAASSTGTASNTSMAASNTSAASSTSMASNTGKGGQEQNKPGLILEDDMPLQVFMRKVYKPGWDKWWWDRNEKNIVSWEKKTRYGGQRSKLNYAKLNQGLHEKDTKGRSRLRKPQLVDKTKADLGKKRHGGNKLRGCTVVMGPLKREKRAVGVKSARGKVVEDKEGSEPKRRRRNEPKSRSVSSDGDSNAACDVPDDEVGSSASDKPVAENRSKLQRNSSCPVCDMVIRKEELAQHHKAHFRGAKKWQCVHCHVSINCDFLSHLGKHLREARSDGEHFCCEKCGFASDNNAIYELHMRDHVLTSQFCATCQKTVTGDYLSHVKEHRLRNSATLWKCNTCSDSFKTSNALEKHLLSHTELQHELFGCPLCSATFDNMAGYSDHLRSHADRITVHICLLCDATCFSEEELIKHVKVHVALDKACADCGVVFPCGDKSAIAQHKCELHGVSLICNECGVALPCGDDNAISQHKCVLDR